MSAAFDLGYLVFLNYDDDAGALRSLEDGLGLAEHAESLGYDTSWVRVHHGARTLSAPFPYLTAAALRTSRIRLGTAVIPVGEEDPLRFAENAATADLFSRGRLELGLSSGIPTGPADAAERGRIVGERLVELLAAVRGAGRGAAGSSTTGATGTDTTQQDTADVAPLPHGPVHGPSVTVAYPSSPGLAERLWYGPGSRQSALRAARLGFDLVLSTIHSEATGATLGHTQAALIEEYRAVFAEHHPERTPRVALGRSILPIVDEADRREYGGLVDFYDRLVTPDGRYTDDSGFAGQASPLYAGSPEQIVDRLAADPSLALIDELVLTPLTELTVDQKRRVLASVAEHVAPSLGWRRSAVLQAH